MRQAVVISRLGEAGRRMARRTTIVGVMICTLGSLAACKRNLPGKEVVLYSSVDESYSREVARCFEQETGIKVKLVSDTEATKSTGLLNRLIAEKERPVADVFWSGDVMRAAVLKKHGISRSYSPAGTEALPTRHSDPDHAYTGSSGRLRLIIYHKGGVQDGRALPSSVLDLAEPGFAPSACLANPLFGTSSMHAAVLFESLGEARAKKFFADFSANGGRIVSSNGEVKRRVASGEFAFGLTDSDDFSVALAEAKPVGFIIPDQGDGDMGVVLIPTAAVLIQGGPNPEQAARLVDFLVSENVERLMAENVAGHIPLRQGMAGPGWLDLDLGQIRTASPDYVALAERIEVLQRGYLKEWTEALVD